MVESVYPSTYSIEQVKRTLINTMYMIKISYNAEVVGIGKVVCDRTQIEFAPNVGNEDFYKKLDLSINMIL